MTREEYTKLLKEQIEILKTEQTNYPVKTIEFSAMILELAKELYSL